MEKVWDELKKIEAQAEEIRSQAQKKADEIKALAKQYSEKLTANGQIYSEQEGQEIFSNGVDEANRKRKEQLEANQKANEKLKAQAKKNMDKAIAKVVNAITKEDQV